MTHDYIYIKLYSNVNINLSDLKVKLINKCNKIVFSGKTDCFGKIKIPICANEVYKLIVYYNLSIFKIPLIAKKNEVYCINISNNNNQNKEKHLITIRLMDKYNPNIKIKGGKMIIWQDIQSQ